MRTFEHFLGLALFVGLFFLGKMITVWGVRDSKTGLRLRNLFRCGGMVMETAAVIGGLVESVAVVLLLT